MKVKSNVKGGVLGGLGGGAQVFSGSGPIFLRSNVEG